MLRYFKIIVLLRQNTLLLQLRPVRFNVNSAHEYSLYIFLLVFVFRVKTSFIIQKSFGFFLNFFYNPEMFWIFF